MSQEKQNVCDRPAAHTYRRAPACEYVLLLLHIPHSKYLNNNVMVLVLCLLVGVPQPAARHTVTRLLSIFVNGNEL